VPVDAPGTGMARTLADASDQHPADALAPCDLPREQVLQMAGRPDHRGAAMEDVVREADELAGTFRDQTVDRLVGAE